MNKKYDEKLTGTGREKKLSVIPECFSARANARSTFREGLDVLLRKCRESKSIDPRLKIAGMTMVHSLLFISCFLLLFSGVAEAADRFWVGNGGNWSDAANHWATASGGAPGAGNLPTSADNCYFNANSFSSASQTVTLDAQTPDPVCASMIWTGATNSPTLSFSDNLDIYGSITFISGMTVNAGTSTVTLRAASGALTLTSAGKSFYNLTMNDAGGTATYTLQDALSVGNDLTLTNGILDTKSGSNYAVNVTNDWIQATTATATVQSSTLTVGRHFTGDGTEGNGQYNSANLVMTGTGTLNLNNNGWAGSQGFTNLTVGQSGNTVTLADDLAIRNGVLTIGSGTLTGSTKAIWFNSAAASYTPLSFNAASTLSINAIRFYPTTNYTIPSLTNGYDCHIYVTGNNDITQIGDIVINSSKGLSIDGDQVVTRTPTWNTSGYNLTIGGNLVVGGSGADTALKKLDASGVGGRISTVTVSGNLSFAAGADTVVPVIVAGDAAFIFKGTVTLANSANWTKGTGTITLGDNPSNGTQTINFLGATIDDLIINGSGDTKQLTNTSAVTTDSLTVTAGTLDMNGKALTLATAQSVVNDATIQLTSAETLTNFNDLDENSGTVKYVGDNDAVADTISIFDWGAIDYFNLTIDGAETGLNKDIFKLQGNIDIDGNLTLTDGTFDVDSVSNYTINLAGTWTNTAATFQARSGTVTFDGTATGKTIASGGQNFNILTINGSGGAWTLNTNNLTAAALNVTAGTLLTSTLNLTVTGTTTLNGGNLTGGSGTMTFGSGGGGNLAISNASSTFTASSTVTMTDAGPYTRSAGTADWTTNTSTFTINPTVGFTLPVDTYHHLAIQAIFITTLNLGTGTTTVNGNLTISNCVEGCELNVGSNTLTVLGNLSNAHTLNGSSGSINVRGNWSNTGTFTAGTSTVTFNSTSADQTVTTNGQAFNHLILNNTGASGSDDIIISGALDINGNLTITDGDLDLGVNNPNATLAGNLSIASAGSVTKGSGTWTFDGTTAVTAGSAEATPSSLGAVTINKTDTVAPGTNNKVTLNNNLKVDTLTVNNTTDQADTIALASYTLTIANAGATANVLTVTSPATFTANTGTTTFTATNSAGNINIPVLTYYSLTINGSTETYDLAGNIDVDGTLTFAAGTLDATTTNYNINLAGGWTLQSGSFTERQGTVTFDGSAAQAIFGGETFYNLTINNSYATPDDSNDVDPNLSVIVSNTLTVTDGQFQPFTGSTFKDVSIGAAGILKPDSGNTINVSGNWTNNNGTTSFVANSGTVTLNGGGGTTQTLTGSTTFYNLTKDTTSANTLSLNDANVFTVTNNLLLKGRTGQLLTLQSSSGSLTVDFDLQAGGTQALDYLTVCRIDSATGLAMRPTNSSDTGCVGSNVNWFFAAEAATFNWDGSSSTAWNTAANWDQGLVPRTGDSVVIVDASNDPLLGAATTVNNLTINTGAILDLNGYGLTVSTTFSNNGTVRLIGSETSSISLTQDINSGTWTYYGDGTGAATTHATKDFGATDYYNLTLNDTSASNKDTFRTGVTSPLTIAGALNVTAGTLDISTNADKLTTTGTLTVDGGTLTATSGDIDANGAVQVTSGTLTAPSAQDDTSFTVAGNWEVSGTGTFTHSSGRIVMDTAQLGTKTIITSSSNSTAFYDLTLNPFPGGVTYMLEDDLDVDRNLTISAEELDVKSVENNSINVGGNWSNSATFTERSGVVTFDGSAAQTLTGETFYDLTINNSAVTPSDTVDVDSSAAVTVSNTLTVTDGQFQPTTASSFKDVSIGAAGILKPDASASISVSGNWSKAGGGTFTANSGTVTFNGAVAQTLTGETFYNLTINNTHASPDDSNDVDSSAAVTVSNTLTVTDGQFQPTTASTFKDVSISAAGILKPDSGNNINVSGNWSKTAGGTFTSNTGTVTFNGAVAQTLTGETFYNLTINNTYATPDDTNDVDSSALVTVTNTLTVTDGQFQPTTGSSFKNITIYMEGTLKPDASASITVSGNWDNNGPGIFTPNAGTVTFNSSSADQTVLEYSFYHLILNNTGSAGNDDIIISGGYLDINGDLTITDGDLDLGVNPNVTLAGALSIASIGSVTKGSGTWTFDGITAVTAGDANATPSSLGAVTINKTDTVAPGTNNKVTLNNHLKVDTLTVDGTVGSADTLDLGAGGYTLTLANQGAAAAVLTVNGTFTAGTSTVKYTATNSAGNITVTNVTYSTLELNAAETFVTGAGVTLTAANITVSAGTFQPGTTNTLSLSQNLALNGTSTFDETNNPVISVGGDLTVANGVTWTRGSGTLTMPGTGTTPTLTDNRAVKGDLGVIQFGS